MKFNDDNTMTTIPETKPCKHVAIFDGGSQFDNNQSGASAGGPYGSYQALGHELWSILHLALPSVVTQILLYGLFPMTTSEIGRNLTSTELAGLLLGCLVGNLSCLSVIMGALTAADTLLPRAYGARQFRQVAVLTCRTYIVCMALLVIPMILLSRKTTLTKILALLGQGEEVAEDAAKWTEVYLVGLPATTLFRTFQRFCVAQNVPWTPAIAALLPVFVLHPILLKLLVGSHGLMGSAWAIVATQYFMTALLLFHMYVLRPGDFHPESWPCLTSRDFWATVFSREPLLEFINLALGGVASRSEWWFREVATFLVGTFGVVPFCAHSIAYSLAPILFMLPYGLGVGLTVRMGIIMAASTADVGDALTIASARGLADVVKHLKMVAAMSLLVSTLLGAFIAIALYVFRGFIIRLFTNDEEVFEQTDAIWWKVCHYIFIIHIFGIQDAILRGLAKPWRTAMVLVLCLWCVTLPAIFYLAKYHEMRLEGLWSILVVVYTIMQFLLALGYIINVDWQEACTTTISSQEQHIMSDEETVKSNGIEVETTASVWIARTASPTFGSTIPVPPAASVYDDRTASLVLTRSASPRFIRSVPSSVSVNGKLSICSC